LNTIIQQDGVRQHLYKSLEELSLTTTGSSNFVRRAVFADFELSMDKGEITDKGTINQRIVLQNHQDLVEQLYSDPKFQDVIEVEIDYNHEGYGNIF
jgi:feruloyl-CoA synthase